jgi:hypothetical protein
MASGGLAMTDTGWLILATFGLGFVAGIIAGMMWWAGGRR